MATKTTNIFWWILGGGLLYALAKNSGQIVSQATANLYRFSNPRMSRPNITLLNLNLNASIDVTNNTAISPTLNSLVGKVFVKGTEIGFFDTSDQVILPANGTRTIPFTVTLKNLDIISVLVSEFTRVREAGGISVPEIRFIGRAVINGVGFNFDRNYVE